MKTVRYSVTLTYYSNAATPELAVAEAIEEMRHNRDGTTWQVTDSQTGQTVSIDESDALLAAEDEPEDEDEMEGDDE